MAKQTSGNNTMKWALLGVVVVLFVAVLYLVGGDYLTASLTGPDVVSNYNPLVRHQESQNECVDDGSQFCEESGFTKEFTLGYIFGRKRTGKGLDSVPLYSCANRRGRTFLVTKDLSECKDTRAAKMTRYQLGFIATTNTFEAPTALYRCFNKSSKSMILTDDPDECALAEYGEAEQLGYVASAGHLPQRRLNEFCGTVQTECSKTPNRVPATVCAARESFCKGPS